MPHLTGEGRLKFWLVDSGSRDASGDLYPVSAHSSEYLASFCSCLTSYSSEFVFSIDLTHEELRILWIRGIGKYKKSVELILRHWDCDFSGEPISKDSG